MNFQEHELVVLRRDLAGSGLCQGDVGTVVHVYDTDAVEVEFCTASGRTRALVTLTAEDIRAAEDSDQLAVRPIRRETV